ncbi:MAG: hypothetical protein B6D44_04265 [Ignavibacteriales bacterium UTCHB2]|nr:MAG: hypothetical protein B6D44_04265 [Ignavibacteriales bacterium UTCHB2]
MNDKNQLISYEELLTTQMLQIESIERILVKKGITTQDELLKEVEIVKLEIAEKVRKMSKEN